MTKTASERARELPPGPELDALFFETCWPNEAWSLSHRYWMSFDGQKHYIQHESPVSTDAAACEAWAMRWAHEKGMRYEIIQMTDHILVILSIPNYPFGFFELGRGADYKVAFARACVVAAETIAKRTPEPGDTQ